MTSFKDVKQNIDAGKKQRKKETNKQKKTKINKRETKQQTKTC